MNAMTANAGIWAIYWCFFNRADAWFVIKVEMPDGVQPCISNSASWIPQGLLSSKFQVRPDPLNAEIYWFLTGLPSDSKTKVRWDVWDSINNRLDVGCGTSPDITVTYEDLLSEYDDFMPPNNSWFGQKSVTVTVSGNTIAVRPMWFYFSVQAIRPNLNGDKMAAWCYYWKQGAVLALSNFEYVHNLSSLSQHTWSLLGGDTFQIGFNAWTGIAKPVFDVNVHTYTEQAYPDHKGVGIHGVAKICAHENWHAVMDREVRSVLLGGGGETDTDGDRLSDTREDELGTRLDMKDTCNLSSYTGGGANYSDYADYADQELYCRWKQEGVLGDETKDWASPGMQHYNKP